MKWNTRSSALQLQMNTITGKIYSKQDGHIDCPQLYMSTSTGSYEETIRVNIELKTQDHSPTRGSRGHHVYEISCCPSVMQIRKAAGEKRDKKLTNRHN